MKRIAKTTKKASAMLAAYFESQASRLDDVYGSYSAAKARAERDCLRRFEEEGGKEFRVFNANTFSFCAGWTLRDGSVRVETASNSFIIC